MTGRERYGAVLKAPHVASLLGLTLLARAEVGLNGLAIVLVVRDAADSYAAAGAVAAAYAAGIALFAPIAGRLVDRYGARKILLRMACAHAAALIALAVMAPAGAPTIAMGIVALAAGCAIPPTGGVMRTLWPDLVDAELLQTAFALDSITVEFAFMVGPLIVALTAAAGEPGAALLISAVVVLAGVAAFTSSAPVRRRAETHIAPTGTTGRLGALRSRGVLTIVLSVIPVGFCLGAAEVAFPAFGDALGDNALAGPLIALWSLGSFIGGLAYGAYGHRLGAVRAFEWGVIALPITTLPLALASSFAGMVPLALLAGAAVAPMLAAANQLIGEVAPREAQTEAYTWPTTAIVTGVTVGNAASGAIIELQDWSAAFVMAAVVGATGFFVVMARRGTFESARAQA